MHPRLLYFSPPHRCLTLPSVASKLGHSMENIHRVSSHGVPEGRMLSLGEHGTFVSCTCSVVCVCGGGAVRT